MSFILPTQKILNRPYFRKQSALQLVSQRIILDYTIIFTLIPTFFTPKCNERNYIYIEKHVDEKKLLDKRHHREKSSAYCLLAVEKSEIPEVLSLTAQTLCAVAETRQTRPPIILASFHSEKCNVRAMRYT
jgi:hypothetical protein